MLLGQVTYAVCSGSEANDLAFRIARAVRLVVQAPLPKCNGHGKCFILFWLCQAMHAFLRGNQTSCRPMAHRAQHTACVTSKTHCGFSHLLIRTAAQECPL